MEKRLMNLFDRELNETKGRFMQLYYILCVLLVKQEMFKSYSLKAVFIKWGALKTHTHNHSAILKRILLNTKLSGGPYA